MKIKKEIIQRMHESTRISDMRISGREEKKEGRFISSGLPLFELCAVSDKLLNRFF